MFHWQRQGDEMPLDAAPNKEKNQTVSGARGDTSVDLKRLASGMRVLGKTQAPKLEYRPRMWEHLEQKRQVQL